MFATIGGHNHGEKIEKDSQGDKGTLDRGTLKVLKLIGILLRPRSGEREREV